MFGVGTYTEQERTPTHVRFYPFRWCTFLPLPLVYVSTRLQHFCCFSLVFRKVFLRNIRNNDENEGFPRVGTYTEQERTPTHVRFYPFRRCTFLFRVRSYSAHPVFLVFPMYFQGFLCSKQLFSMFFLKIVLNMKEKQQKRCR